MATETTIALAILLGVGVSLAAVNTLPPLTEGGLARTAKDSDTRIPHQNELAYCEAELSGVNCQCFSHVAFEVMTNKSTRAPGWSYADQWALARAQASESCS